MRRQRFSSLVREFLPHACSREREGQCSGENFLHRACLRKKEENKRYKEEKREARQGEKIEKMKEKSVVVEKSFSTTHARDRRERRELRDSLLWRERRRNSLLCMRMREAKETLFRAREKEKERDSREATTAEKRNRRQRRKKKKGGRRRRRGRCISTMEEECR